MPGESSEKENQIEVKNTSDKRIQFQSSTALVENSQPPTRVASNEQLNQQTKPQVDIPKGEVFVKVAFFVFGFGSLTVWNAILSVIDFFDYFEPTRNVSTLFPFLYFCTNILFQLYSLFDKKRIAYKTLLMISLGAFIIFQFLYPTFVIYTSEKVGFGLICVSILLTGCASAITQSCFYGIMAFFPVANIILFSAGSAVCGILMNVIRYILLASITGDDEKHNQIVGAWIFFSISALVMIITLVFVLVTYRVEYFIYLLQNTDEVTPEMLKLIQKEGENKATENIIPSTERETNNNQPDELSVNMPSVNQEEDNVETPKKNDVVISSSKEEDSKTEENPNTIKSFLEIVKDTLSIDILLCVTYIVTFTVFPGTCLKPRFFSLKNGWSSTTVMLIFNIFDTIGRQILSFFKPRKCILYVVALSRIILVITLPLNVFSDRSEKFGDRTGNGIFLVINMILLSFTNGLASSLAFALAPEQVENEKKGRASKCVGFFNIFGIFLGTCLAFAMDAIVGDE